MSKKRASRLRKIGVVIANTGTPSAPTPKAVKQYLAQFLMDPRICPMPRPVWWLLLHTVILRKRARASAVKYESIWTAEGSPLIATTESLERGLNEYYARAGLPVVVRTGMSYGKPGIKHAVKELKEAGCTELVVLPMYPQSAFSTTGSVSDAAKKAVRRARFKGRVRFIDGYGEDSVYVRAIAASIRNAGFSEEAGDRLLFSFHSIPLKDIEAGDTYELQTGATSLAIAGELGLDRRSWTISYQSRFDKGRTWLSPFTRPTLVRLAQAAACTWCARISRWTAWRRSTTCRRSWSPSTARRSLASWWMPTRSPAPWRTPASGRLTATRTWKPTATSRRPCA